MEERSPPPAHANRHDHAISESDLDHSELSFISPSGVTDHVFISAGNYVVQVPKDQIYRVPPPENALIVERHRNPERRNRSHCYSFCWCFVLTIIVILLAGGVLIAGVSYIFLIKPAHPNVLIDHFLLRNSTNSRSKHMKLEYDIKMKVKNPNAHVGIAYEQGRVVLHSSKQGAIIGSGRYPSFNQDSGESTVVAVVLKGSNAGLPKEMQKSTKSGDKKKKKKKKNHVTLDLKVDMPARMKAGLLKTGGLEFVVSCSFMVDTLNKGSRIVSQKCQTERKLL